MVRRRRRSSKRLSPVRSAAAIAVAVLAIMSFAASQVSSQAIAVVVALGALFVAAAIWWRLDRARRRRLRAKTLGELLAMTPTQFEQAIADLLHDIGYRD